MTQGNTATIPCTTCGTTLVQRPVKNTKTIYLVCPVCDAPANEPSVGGIALHDDVEKAQTDKYGYDSLEKAA